MQTQFGLVAMIEQGWYATYPLLAISVICLAIIFERLVALHGIRTRAASVAETLIDSLRQGRFDEALQRNQNSAGPSERVFEVLISEARSQNRERLLEIDQERRFQELVELKRYTWVLATSGASAPFIGLFGTVVGILIAFQSMAVMGTGGFSAVAAGISEALISTALGLAVAIIAVIFYNYLSVKIEDINSSLQIHGLRLIDAALKGRQTNAG